MPLRPIARAPMRLVAALATALVPFAWAAGAGGDEPSALAGAVYAPGRAFVRAWCADCHTERGASPKQPRAHRALRLDTYDDWRTHQSAIRGAIDKWDPDGKIMPPRSAKAQPSDRERRVVLAWLARGSPNTVDGR